MNYEQTIKPTAFMKQDVLDTLHPQDCFFVFATADQYAQVPLFTWDLVKKILLDSNESRFDAESYIGFIESQLEVI